jgi:hypothetical protein
VDCKTRNNFNFPGAVNAVLRKRFVGVLLIICGCFLFKGDLSAQENRGIKNHFIGSTPMKGNEPAIAFSPVNPLVGILAYNVNQVFVTNDAGRTWDLVVVDPKQGFYGDPVLKWAKNNTVYLAHLAKNKQLPWPQHFDRIVFERSQDGGRSFTATDVGYNEGKMQDKPWFSIDEWQGSSFTGSIYLSYTEFDKYSSMEGTDSSRIYCAVSRDGGASFDKPVKVSDVCGDATDDDGTAEGANCTVTPDGVVHMVWARNDTIWYDKSVDGGKTWGKDRMVAVQYGGWNHNLLAGQMRANGMPFIVSTRKGDIYIAFSGSTAAVKGMGKPESTGTLYNPDLDVFLYRSSDRGETFESIPGLSHPGAQYSPMIATDSKGHEVWLCWMDRRRSETGFFSDLFGCKISGTKVSAAARWSSVPSLNPGKSQFMGDYLGLHVGSDKVWAAYTAWSLSDKFPYVRMVEMHKKKNKGKGYTNIEYADILVYPFDPAQESSKGNKEKRLILWVEWPNAKSLTIEIKQGKQIVFQNVIEQWELGYMDFSIPIDRLGKGVFEVNARYKGIGIKQSLYLP